MRWQTQEAWFELLIKWKEYEQKTWESYMTIKKNVSILIKKFHEDYFLWSALIKWAKNRNKWLFFNKQTSNSTRIKKNMKLTEIITSILIEMQIQSLIWNIISITCIWRNWMNKLQIFFLRIFSVDERYCNETDSVNRYDDLIKHLSWISIST